MRFRQTVLVVEDDPFIRLVAIDALDEGGFEAVDFGRADTALAYADRSEGGVAALITDIGLPGDRDGIELALAFADRWPDTLILATSGHFGHGRPAELPARALFLAKPWRGRDIVAALEAGLRSGPSGLAA